ncbi:MAG TPA: DUF4864 domain-containing protein [Chthoniobacteraceae bacterium]|jgi:hypothetical protein
MNQRAKIALVLCMFAICGTAAVAHRWMETRRTSARPAELYDIVWRQIEAVRESDYTLAYRQASMSFQEKFNVETYADLIRTEYPELLRANRVEFGAVRLEGRQAIIPVYFILNDGEVIPCLYCLVFEENAWKIEAARVHRRWPSGRRLGGLRT